MNQLGFDSMLFPEYCLMFFFLFKKKKTIAGTACFASGKPAKKWTYWGRSY
jgi:hypothetical protein